MNIDSVIKKLNEEYKCDISSAYYKYIAIWEDWWRGCYKPFHQYQEVFDKQVRERELYTLKMAKKVCEDWASILLNEKTEIIIDDETAAQFILGSDNEPGVFGANDFWNQGNALIEKAFYGGTGAFVLKVNNVSVDGSGKVLANDQARIAIEYLDATHIVPLSIKNGKITEVAFVSDVVDKGNKYVYVETHTLSDNGTYVIQNRYYKDTNGALTIEPLPAGVAEMVHTNSDIPWFALVKPNIVNNIKNNNGLGISIYANAIDTLKGVDLAFNNFCRDFKLGGKKVFMNKAVVQEDKDGVAITPDDAAQQLFVMVGDEANLDEQTMIVEHNPDLRIDDNTKGLQSQLDYLSFKCGLGTGYYQFQSSAGKIMTATEYVGNRQDLIQNANKHYIVIESAIKSIIKAILDIANHYCGMSLDPNVEVTVNFEDSYITDKESERERDRQDIRDGMMQKWEYRVKWLGETEEDAKKILAENAETEDKMMFGGGE